MRVSFNGGAGVVTTSVVPVDGIFAAGDKARRDQFGRGLDQIVPVKHPGVLRSYSGCFHERDWEKRVLKDFPAHLP